MRCRAVVITLCLLCPSAVSAQDALGEARRLYNTGQFDEAERLARSALEQAALANSARVVLGRILLERYRKSPGEGSLADAKRSLREADPRQLDARERVELALGFAETLFLEDRFLAAAEMFAPLLDSSSTLGPAAHDRVLDWWATALDRHAQTRPPAERGGIYGVIAQRMATELSRDPGSGPAGYWTVAAARGIGDLDKAWNAAVAAWIRATLGADRGVILRGDLDRLVIHAVIPERATRLSPRDPGVAITGLLSEWEAFKAGWNRQ